MVAASKFPPEQIEAISRSAQRFSWDSGTVAHKLSGSNPVERELFLCAADREYFIRTYCKIYDSETQDWIDFDLWDEQVDVLELVIDHQQTIVLKARQLGLTWLMLAFALHQMIFRPIAEVLIFSKREDEAIYLLSNERLKGMYDHLPQWMKPGKKVDAAKHFQLANGSSARAFPSNAGDSYTATFAIIDEADLVPDLKQLLSRVKPTIDAGGKLVMISRADKSKPESLFKSIYKAAKRKANDWASAFLAWYVRPERTQDWYERICEDAMQNEGTLDTVHEQYPATDEEAMNPRSLNKRIPAEWLDNCYEELVAVDHPLAFGDLTVFRHPVQFRSYVAGMDCAEGLLSSDDSVTQWVDAETGEQVAVLAGKLSPEVQAYQSARISEWYNQAPILVENNNHGHAAILWLNDNGHGGLVLTGHNNKDGWSSNSLGKSLMYSTGAEAAKDEQTTIHDYTTLIQLKAIEKSTLRAPEGQMDDYADAYVLALEGRKQQASNRITYRRGKARL